MTTRLERTAGNKDKNGYGGALRGEDLPQSKLSEEAVRRIRRQHARKEALVKRLHERYGAAAIAEREGVSESTVYKVLTFELWRHVL